MKVAIITNPHFNDIKFIDTIMEELIEQSQCYLFTVLCSANSPARSWCQQRGCPHIIISKEWELWTADFFLIIDDNPEDRSLVNVAMKIKMMENKHGKYIKY